MSDKKRIPLFVNRVQFETFKAAGLDTSNMEIVRSLPTLAVSNPAAAPIPAFEADECDCGLCSALRNGIAF